MRFNLISESGDGLGFATRLQEEGNEVRLWIRDHAAAEIGDGLVPKVGTLEDLLSGADEREDVFLFDGSGNGIVADYLRDKGFPVLGASLIADRLEKDRQFGTEVMKEFGIDVPETFEFHTWEDARSFIEGYEDRLVYKPSKALGELSMSHVSYDKEDMLEMLDNAEDEASIEEPTIQLQQFVEGIPLSTEVWFDGVNFLPLENHTFERKELMNGNLGPSGGCTGNIVWACGTCPICEMVRKLEVFLRKNNYVGMIDLNAVVSSESMYGLEWTPRCGYDATPTLAYGLVNGELGRFFADIARHQYGEGSPRLRESVFAAGLKISYPPWPTERYEAHKNIPIRGLRPVDKQHVYWYNVKESEDKPGEVDTAGAWGAVAVLVDSAPKIEDAFDGLYKIAKRLRLPDKQYRTDLIEQFEKDVRKLENLFDEVSV